MRHAPAFLQLGRLLAASALLPASLLPLPVQASDHADPMSLNMLKVQEDPEANITDLHAFVVDVQGRRILDPARLHEGERLVVSLCVRRALRPQDAEGLDVSGFKFVLHLDLDPEVRFFDETKTRDGEDYAKALAAINARIQAATAASIKAVPASLEKAQTDDDLAKAQASLAALISQRQTDAMMQALYGGIIPHPDSIADGATMTFELLHQKDGVNSDVSLKSQHIEGIAGPVSVVSDRQPLVTKNFDPSTTYIQAGIFDDPFIFPRFFRRNVVGIVASIPLSHVLKHAKRKPILLWATTRKEKQIDHVGRSLRTQLPRFGYLNDKHPSRHLAAIMQVHDRPTLMENITATFISPLIAHRHYDSVPDVMIYDLRKPALFPNGRGFEDDVAKTLADAGETLLYELSYAESRQYPRATRNDREFKPDFPYLADRWIQSQIDAAIPGTPRPGVPAVTSPGPVSNQFQRLEAEQTGYVSQAPDASAISAPNLTDHTWRLLWFIEILGLILLTVLLLFTLRSKALRWFTVAVALITAWWLQAVFAPNVMGMAGQPQDKLNRLIIGGVILALMKVIWLVALGRHSTLKWPLQPAAPARDA